MIDIDTTIETLNYLKVNNNEIARTLKGIREQKGITQVELARRLEIHPVYLQLLEYGKRRLSPERIKNICMVLNHDYRLLVDGMNNG